MLGAYTCKVYDFILSGSVGAGMQKHNLASGNLYTGVQKAHTVRTGQAGEKDIPGAA